MTDAFTYHVGEKFNEDGSVRPYPGVTIICFAQASDALYQAGVQVQAGLQQQPYGHKFALLPPPSFHMTVFSLILDAQRDPSYWSPSLPLDAPLAQADAFFEARVAAVPPPAGLRMCLTYIGGRGLSFRLSPADEHTYDALRAYRAHIAQATGVRHPDHDTYEFHLTLAYNLQVLTHEENQAFGRWRTAQGEALRCAVGIFAPLPPVLTFFDDMFRFVPWQERHTLVSRSAPASV
jgi:hypothetical protein